MSKTTPMSTCATCQHRKELHRLGGCRVVSGCSCVLFVESVLSRPIEADWLRVGGFKPVQPGRETRDAA